MTATAKILSYDGKTLLLLPNEDIQRELNQKEIKTVEIRLDDGRRISSDQRKKIFALIRDISLWSGHEPEYLRRYLTWDFIRKTDREWFSLSDVDMTTAKEFINDLIGFCFEFDVPTKDTLLFQTDDIGKYLYQCLEHRKCAICNRRAEIHHVDRLGMGADRNEAVHLGMLAAALCREHHIEAHTREKELFKEYFIYGIRLDQYLCERLRLRTKRRGTK